MIGDLIASNFIERANVGTSFLKYFYLEAHESLPFAPGNVVDFSKCFSVRNQSYTQVLDKKVLQLLPDIRREMSLKLALYFCREIPEKSVS